MRIASTTGLTSKHSVLLTRPGAGTRVELCWIIPIYPTIIQCSRSDKFDIATWGKYLWVSSFFINNQSIESFRFKMHEKHIVYTQFSKITYFLYNKRLLVILKIFRYERDLYKFFEETGSGRQTDHNTFHQSKETEVKEVVKKR